MDPPYSVPCRWKQPGSTSESFSEGFLTFSSAIPSITLTCTQGGSHDARAKHRFFNPLLGPMKFTEDLRMVSLRVRKGTKDYEDWDVHIPSYVESNLKSQQFVDSWAEVRKATANLRVKYMDFFDKRTQRSLRRKSEGLPLLKRRATVATVCPSSSKGEVKGTVGPFTAEELRAQAEQAANKRSARRHSAPVSRLRRPRSATSRPRVRSSEVGSADRRSRRTHKPAASAQGAGQDDAQFQALMRATDALWALRKPGSARGEATSELKQALRGALPAVVKDLAGGSVEKASAAAGARSGSSLHVDAAVFIPAASSAGSGHSQSRFPARSPAPAQTQPTVSAPTHTQASSRGGSGRGGDAASVAYSVWSGSQFGGHGSGSRMRPVGGHVYAKSDMPVQQGRPHHLAGMGNSGGYQGHHNSAVSVRSFGSAPTELYAPMYSMPVQSMPMSVPSPQHMASMAGSGGAPSPTFATAQLPSGQVVLVQTNHPQSQQVMSYQAMMPMVSTPSVMTSVPMAMPGGVGPVDLGLAMGSMGQAVIPGQYAIGTPVMYGQQPMQWQSQPSVAQSAVPFVSMPNTQQQQAQAQGRSWVMMTPNGPAYVMPGTIPTQGNAGSGQ